MAPHGASIDQTAKDAERIEGIAKGIPEVDRRFRRDRQTQPRPRGSPFCA